MLGLTSVISSMSRLCITAPVKNTLCRSIWTQSSLNFHVTPCMLGEPLRRKKKLDPAIIRGREERRKRKIEKVIRRLTKATKQLKNIEEVEVPLGLIDGKAARTRPPPQLSEDDNFKRIELNNTWAVYCRQQVFKDLKEIDRIEASQQKALDELRLESEELYQEAIQLDPELLQFKTKGPMQTPPIKNYDSPDGEYVDVSNKWDN